MRPEDTPINVVQIGPVMRHIIENSTDSSNHAEQLIKMIRQGSMSGVEIWLSRNYKGPLAVPKGAFDMLQPYMNMGNSYELWFEYNGRKMMEIVVEDFIQHHVQMEIPESMKMRLTGMPLNQVVDVKNNEILRWKGNEIIQGWQRTNDRLYFVIYLDKDLGKT